MNKKPYQVVLNGVVILTTGNLRVACNKADKVGGVVRFIYPEGKA